MPDSPQAVKLRRLTLTSLVDRNHDQHISPKEAAFARKLVASWKSQLNEHQSQVVDVLGLKPEAASQWTSQKNALEQELAAADALFANIAQGEKTVPYMAPSFYNAFDTGLKDRLKHMGKQVRTLLARADMEFGNNDGLPALIELNAPQLREGDWKLHAESRAAVNGALINGLLAPTAGVSAGAQTDLGKQVQNAIAQTQGKTIRQPPPAFDQEAATDEHGVVHSTSFENNWKAVGESASNIFKTDKAELVANWLSGADENDGKGTILGQVFGAFIGFIFGDLLWDPLYAVYSFVKDGIIDSIYHGIGSLVAPRRKDA